MTNWAALNTLGAPSSDESDRDTKEKQPRVVMGAGKEERTGKGERESHVMCANQ